MKNTTVDITGRSGHIAWGKTKRPHILSVTLSPDEYEYMTRLSFDLKQPKTSIFRERSFPYGWEQQLKNMRQSQIELYGAKFKKAVRYDYNRGKKKGK